MLMVFNNYDKKEDTEMNYQLFRTKRTQLEHEAYPCLHYRIHCRIHSFPGCRDLICLQSLRERARYLGSSWIFWWSTRKYCFYNLSCWLWLIKNSILWDFVVNSVDIRSKVFVKQLNHVIILFFLHDILSGFSLIRKSRHQMQYKTRCHMCYDKPHHPSLLSASNRIAAN